MKSIKTISLLIILFFFSLDSANSKSINVEINKNVETLAILYLLADVGLNQPSGYLEPLREKAKEHFWSYKNHKAVKLLNNYLVRIGVDGPIDIMMHLSPLPNPKLVNGISNRLLESISGTQDKTKGEVLLNEFISAFNDFYKTAKVDDFLQEHKNYYYHVKEEVLQNLPDANFVRVMENYYGKENLSYTLIPAPILHPTCGFGVRINTKKGLNIFNIFGPTIATSNTSKYKYGFDDEKSIREKSVHEFGHSFVNPLFELQQNIDCLRSLSSLYNPIKKKMSEQGYTNWTTCVIEHIVRLGEIRIAHALNNSVRADQIRNEYVKKRQFIYIPFLEKSIQTYEKNRYKYKSFEDYFPELLKVFQNIDVSNIK